MPMNRPTPHPMPRPVSFEAAFVIWGASTAGIVYTFALIASLTFAK